MKIKIYADGANIDGMLEEYDKGRVDGFTTNPSLMKKAGVEDYKEFAKEVVTKIKDLPVSFEVFGDDLETMEKEALKLKEYGDNVFVKIPVTNTKGESTVPIIKILSKKGVNLNVTAVFTKDQVQSIVDAVSEESKTIVSVFAGRIADCGVDPEPIMKESAKICGTKKNVELLWASTREIFNVVQAERCGADIITVTNDVLAKLSGFGTSLEQRSLETVIGFNNDVKKLGFSIL